jgi:ribosomal protein S12 methylthiotransferase accessory factor YcaO
LLRALTELNQFLPMVTDLPHDKATRKYRTNDPDTIDWFTSSTMLNQPYLTPDWEARPRTPRDYLSVEAMDLRDEVKACVETTRKAGLEMLCLDQTRTDIGMPVWRVIVPGLRHFWRRLGPGRLYDIPVKLGWLDKSIPEEHLNPISMFF